MLRVIRPRQNRHRQPPWFRASATSEATSSASTRSFRILAKYGLADLVGEKTPGFIQRRFVSAEGIAVRDYPFEVRVRLALTELGTTFIKLGQMMSTRADMVGPELAAELASLQADTPADPPEAVRATIVAELGAAARRNLCRLRL